MNNETENPAPIQLPPTQTPHPSEAQAAIYHDPHAPKPRRSVHWKKLMLIVVTILVLAGISIVLYTQYVKNNQDPSTVKDYSGGIGTPDIAQNQVTAETEAAKNFLQAIQNKDSKTVQELSSDSLKQLALQQTNDQNATALTLYEGKFDGINFDSLISSVSEGDAGPGALGKQVVFSDKAAGEGSTGTYRTIVIVTTENGVLKITSVRTGLEF